MSRRVTALRERAPLALGTIFTGSAVLHTVRPSLFDTLVPDVLPARRFWIYVSGAAEAACGAGLLTRRSWAGPASAALLLAVVPGNVQMARDAGTGRNRGVADSRVLTWARLPLQVPMIWAALQNRPGDESGSRR